MGTFDFSPQAFVRFSNTMDMGMVTGSNDASAVMVKAISEAFGIECAALLFEDFKDGKYKWCTCVSPKLPLLELNADRFLNDPFCNAILDDPAESKLFVCSDMCGGMRFHLNDVPELENAYLCASCFMNNRNQVIIILMFKHGSDFAPHEREMLTLLYEMLSCKCYARDAMVEQYVLSYAHSELLDSQSIGMVVVDSHMSIVDSNSIFREYYIPHLSQQSPEEFIRSLITVYTSTCGDEAPSPQPHTINIGKYSITIRTQQRYTGVHNRKMYYFISIDDGVGMAAKPIREDWRTDFAEKYKLSSREMDIVEALATGRKYQEIADELFISVSTVRTHVKNIYKKLNINNQRSLLYIYGSVRDGG